MDLDQSEYLRHMKEQEELKKQMKQVTSQILTPEARTRLSNIKTVKPQLAQQIELQLIQLYSAGQIRNKITDTQLKELLTRLQKKKQQTFKFR